VHAPQVVPRLAQNPLQLPGRMANALAGHELSADPEAPSDSHVPVVLQNPHPIWAAHATQPVNREHGSPTTASIGRIW
jgi:hypothetical protein